jgi:5-(carboxyamino)imidazole ribonucleotide mutase
MAAHLAGAVAAQTIRPVIGVPLDASLGGADALLSTVQMPGGIPVATVAVGKAGAKNAAYLAAQILGLSDPKVAERVRADRLASAERVAQQDARLAQQRGETR